MLDRTEFDLWELPLRGLVCYKGHDLKVGERILDGLVINRSLDSRKGRLFYRGVSNSDDHLVLLKDRLDGTVCVEGLEMEGVVPCYETSGVDLDIVSCKSRCECHKRQL